MKLEDFFNPHHLLDISFYTFRNAITAAYFANNDLEILKVNDNFRSFFPVLGNVTNAYFPNVLEQLGVPGPQIEDFVTNIEGKGSVLIPQVHIRIDGEEHVVDLTEPEPGLYSLLDGAVAVEAVVRPAGDRR